MKKKGVLLVNLGTPDAPDRWSVYRYLKQFLLDKRVIDLPWLKRNLLVRGIIAPFRSKDSAKIYEKLWTSEGSPIKIYGNIITAELSKILGPDYIVELAMRYQSPSIEEKVNKLIDVDQVNSLLVLPLFPQYASASTGSVHEEVMRLLAPKLVIPPVTFINSFPENEDMIEVFVDNARKYDVDSYDHILFSYHGLPERQLIKTDRTGSHCLKVENCCAVRCDANEFCYSAQCFRTTYAIADKLGLSPDQYTICFQSRLGKDPWKEPFTPDVILDLKAKGAEKLLVFSPAFVADCLETTIEIGVEYQEEFLAMGGKRLDLVASLNDNPKWIEGLRKMVVENLRD